MPILSVIKGILGPVDAILDKFIPDASQKAEAKLEVAKMEHSTERKLIKFSQTVIKEQASVIRAEAEAGGLSASWRPIVMLMFAFIIFNNYILAPYLGSIFGWSLALETPPDLWQLMKIGLGGYVVGRSVEKSVKSWKNGK